MVEQILRGGPAVEALILTNRSNLTDAAGVWAWDLLETARHQWQIDPTQETFGRWLCQHEANLVAEATATFLDERRRLIFSTEILEVR